MKSKIFVKFILFILCEHFIITNIFFNKLLIKDTFISMKIYINLSYKQIIQWYKDVTHSSLPYLKTKKKF